jgi:hypothetical protein
LVGKWRGGGRPAKSSSSNFGRGLESFALSKSSRVLFFRVAYRAWSVGVSNACAIINRELAREWFGRCHVKEKKYKNCIHTGWDLSTYDFSFHTWFYTWIYKQRHIWGYANRQQYIHCLLLQVYKFILYISHMLKCLFMKFCTYIEYVPATICNLFSKILNMLLFFESLGSLEPEQQIATMKALVVLYCRVHWVD